MTTMTPTEQDKELREAITKLQVEFLKKCGMDNLIPHIIDTDDNAGQAMRDGLMQLITADRKRVALEARIHENESLARSVHENTGARGGANIKGFNTAVRYYRENIQGRIVELKQELEVMSKQQLDNVQQLNPKTGQWEDVPPTPFYVRTWLGKWLPVCTKHKLIFKDDANYYHHERYNDCDGGEALISDHKRHLVGYKMAKS